MQIVEAKNKNIMTTMVLPILGAVLAIGHVNAAPNVPTEQAEKLDIKKCMPRVQSLSEFLIKDAMHGSDIVRAKDSDNHLVSFFVSRILAAEMDSPIVMTLAPSPTGCDAVYTQSFVYEKSCKQLEEIEFKAWSTRGMLSKTTVLHQGSTDLYLTPSGYRQQLCLVTKRETVY